MLETRLMTNLSCQWVMNHSCRLFLVATVFMFCGYTGSTPPPPREHMCERELYFERNAELAERYSLFAMTSPAAIISRWPVAMDVKSILERKGVDVSGANKRVTQILRFIDTTSPEFWQEFVSDVDDDFDISDKLYVVGYTDDEGLFCTGYYLLDDGVIVKKYIYRFDSYLDPSHK